jgi:hypothetical protein
MFVQVGSQSSRHISSARAISRSAFIYRLLVLGLVTMNVVLVWQGLGSWPEVTLLALGVIGLTWVMSKFAPFKPRIIENNFLTRAGTLARKIAAYGAPVVAAAVVNIPQLTFQQGAGFLATLLGASTIMLALGKAMDATAFLANVAACTALAVAIYVLPEPAGTSPRPSFSHDVQTDVTLRILLQTMEGNPAETFDVGYSCFAIIPDTWFTKRPLVLLTIASTAIDDEPVVEIPFSPLGYVIKAHEDGRLGAPGFAKAEVTDVFPGESRDVVIRTTSR